MFVLVADARQKVLLEIQHDKMISFQQLDETRGGDDADRVWYLLEYKEKALILIIEPKTRDQNNVHPCYEKQMPSSTLFDYLIYHLCSGSDSL